MRPVLALLLALLLGAAAMRFVAPALRPHPHGPTRVVTLEVGGMTCGDCVRKVTRSVASVPGVDSVNVDFISKRARVVCTSEVADTALTAAVRHAGHEYLGLVIQP